jgi:hypothetical protein
MGLAAELMDHARAEEKHDERSIQAKKSLSGNVKVTMSTSGAVEVDRESLHASKAYQAQIRALERIVAKGVGRAPNPSEGQPERQGITSMRRTTPSPTSAVHG